MEHSRYLSPRAVRGLERVGDLLIPGGEGLPSFSESGLVKHVDRMLAYLPEADRAGLDRLASLLARLPRFALRALLWLGARSRRLPAPVGAVLRLVDLGLKGVVYGVYYSEPAIRRELGWDARVEGD